MASDRSNLQVKELTASNWVFLTLGGGLTLQKDDAVTMESELADRTLAGSFGGYLSVSDSRLFTFIDGDVNTDPTNTIEETAHGMANGDPVRFSNSGGALPGGLVDNRVYYVVNKNDDDFQVSLTSGGAAVSITSAAGGGTHTCYKLSKKLAYSTFEITRA